MLPGGDDPYKIKIDLAHTWGICYGKDEVASGLLFLSVRCGVFGGHGSPYQEQLDLAFDHFKSWCRANKKTSTLTSFAKEELKMKSFLGHCMVYTIGPRPV